MGSDLEDFFRKKLSNQNKFSINLSNLLGYGGESIVFKMHINGRLRAVKIVPNDLKLMKMDKYDENMHNYQQNLVGRFGIKQLLDRRIAYDKLKRFEIESGEFDSTRLKHDNIISYDNIIIDSVHDVFVIVIGT